MGFYVWFGDNKKLLERLAHDLNQVGMLKDSFTRMTNKKEKGRLLQQASLNFIMSYYRNGLLKSRSEELRRYVKFEILRTNALPNGLCKKYYYGAKEADFYTKVNEIQGHFYRALSVPELKDYISHYESVLSLAINENISVRELTHFQSEMGFKAFENALISRLSMLPRREKWRLTNAAVYPQSSNSLDVCDSMNLMLKTLGSLDGDPFVWATTNMLTESDK